MEKVEILLIGDYENLSKKSLIILKIQNSKKKTIIAKKICIDLKQLDIVKYIQTYLIKFNENSNYWSWFFWDNKDKT